MKQLLGLVTIVRNETKYILEWIAHYRSIGVNDIIIYDNGTDDDPNNILSKLAEHAVIRYVHWATRSGLSPQLSAYDHAVKEFGSQYEFLAFFDADEFLVPCSSMSIIDFLDQLASEVGGLAINQRVFGSSGRLTYESELVTRRFCLAAEESYPEHAWVKSILRAGSILEFLSPHCARIAKGRYILPNGQNAFAGGQSRGLAQLIDFSNFQLNHYILKSLEEFESKRRRGGAAAAQAPQRLARYDDRNFFFGRDALINNVVDHRILRSADALHRELSYLQNLLSKHRRYYLGRKEQPGAGLASK